MKVIKNEKDLKSLGLNVTFTNGKLHGILIDGIPEFRIYLPCDTLALIDKIVTEAKLVGEDIGMENKQNEIKEVLGII